MRLVILENYETASEWAAKYVRNAINKFKPGPDKHFVLGLPTGRERKTRYRYFLMLRAEIIVLVLQATHFGWRVARGQLKNAIIQHLQFLSRA